MTRTSSRLVPCLLLTAAAFAQGPVLVQQAVNSGSNLASLTVTLGQLPTPGNVLVVCHDSTSGSNSTVSGGGVSQWTLCRSTIPTDNSEIWAGVVDGSLAPSTLITLGGSPNSASAVVTEWRGVAVPLVFDSAAAEGLDGTVADPVRSGTVVAQDGDLVIATVGVHSGGGETITSVATINGFADLAQPAPAESSIMAAAFLIADQTGPVSHNWVLGFAHRWAAVVVAFRATEVVSAPELEQQTASSGAYVPRLQVELPHAPAPGNSLVVCLDSSSRGNCVLSGGGVGNWLLCASSLTGSALSCLTKNSEIWAGVVDGTPDPRISIGFADGRQSAGAIASEWSGLGTSLDTAGRARQGLGGSRYYPIVAGGLEAGPNDLVIATAGTWLGLNRFSPAARGFTDLGRPAARLRTSLAAAYLVPTEAGAAGTAWTSAFPDLWGSCLVVFRRN
jgi:hypothetical protein